MPLVPIGHIRAVFATRRQRASVNLRDEAIIRLFCDTGVRVSEMAGLLEEARDDQRVPHLDLEQQMIWVLGKGRRFRGVPFGPNALSCRRGRGCARPRARSRPGRRRGCRRAGRR